MIPLATRSVDAILPYLDIDKYARCTEIFQSRCSGVFGSKPFHVYGFACTAYPPSIQSQTMPMQACSTRGLRSEARATTYPFAPGLL